MVLRKASCNHRVRTQSWRQHRITGHRTHVHRSTTSTSVSATSKHAGVRRIFKATVWLLGLFLHWVTSPYDPLPRNSCTSYWQEGEEMRSPTAMLKFISKPFQRHTGHFLFLLYDLTAGVNPQTGSATMVYSAAAAAALVYCLYQWLVLILSFIYSCYLFMFYLIIFALLQNQSCFHSTVQVLVHVTWYKGRNLVSVIFPPGVGPLITTFF